MTLFKRFKKDKQFRNKVLIGIVIFLFVTNFGGGFLETQSAWPAQSICDTYDDGVLNFGGPENCFSLGCVYHNPGAFEYCKAGLDDGDRSYVILDYVESHPEIYNSQGDMCKSGFAELVVVPGVPPNYYLCLSEEDANKKGIHSCRSWQQPIADIFYGIFKDSKIQCPTAAYLVIGTVAFAALAVI